MKEELQNKLYEKYPKIFRQKDLSMKETAMCWGISCGDGWFNIIDTLCSLIQGEIDGSKRDIERYSNWIKEEKLKDDDKRNFSLMKKKFMQDGHAYFRIH